MHSAAGDNNDELLKAIHFPVRAPANVLIAAGVQNRLTNRDIIGAPVENATAIILL